MRIINLTPHTVVFYRGDTPVAQLKPSGTVARVEMSRAQIGTVSAYEIPVFASMPGRVVDLPAAQPNNIFIVSRLVLDNSPDRCDLYVPDELVRDNAGQVIGCRSLSTHAPK